MAAINPISLIPNQTNITSNKYFFLEANISSLNANSISTSLIDLDGQVLTANPTELLLNGTPIATLSNLSSLADWALEKAISSINADGNDLLNVNNISTVNVKATNIFTNTIFANNIFAFSTYTSTISSLAEVADFGFIGQLSCGNAFISTLHTSELTVPVVSSGFVFTQFIGGQEADISTIRVPGNIGLIILDNGGSQFGASAELRCDWFQSQGSNTSFFYDTTISSMRLMTKIPSGYTDNPASRLYVPELSTLAFTVSSINGSEFTSTGISVELGVFSTIAANSISSLGAELRSVFTSSIQFNAGGLNPTFNFDVGSLVNGLKSGLTSIGIGVGTGLGIVATGILAAAFSRTSGNSITNNIYEQYSVPTQLQFSTLGAGVSTFFRYVSSSTGEGNSIPGQELILSTILPANSICVRSIGDPINLADPSTFTSSIQAFGQWVEVPQQVLPSSISSLNEWAMFPALSTISFATGQSAIIQSANSNTNNIALVGSNIQLIGNYTDAQNLLLVSTVSTVVLQGANNNLFGLGLPGLKIDAQNLFLSTPTVVQPGFFNGSTIGANFLYTKEASISSLTVSTLNFIQQGSFGLSSLIYLSTSQLPGFGTSTTTYINTDISLSQNDLYCQQIRLGYLNPSSQPSEIIFHSPNNTQRAFNLGNSDQTIRIQSTTNATLAGYLLDTQVNPPLFSTINQSTAMMAYFPSTTSGTIGISTIGFIPNKVVAGQFASLSTQNLVANTPLVLYQEVSQLTTGGIATSTNTIVIPSVGNYEVATSIQFSKTGGGGTADFWFRLNGTDIMNSGSSVVLPVAGLGNTLGNVSFIQHFNAGDKVQIVVASPDIGVSVAFFQSTVTTPYTRPAIPSVLTACKCLNY